MKREALFALATKHSACAFGMSWARSLPSTARLPRAFTRRNAHSVLRWFKRYDGSIHAGWCVGRLIPVGALSGANLSNANLCWANLSGADLTSADLSNAGLFSADLRYANLSGADLTSADLSNADLTGADLSNADLRGAYLTGADLTSANLRGADLRGARRDAFVMPLNWRGVVKSY